MPPTIALTKKPSRLARKLRHGGLDFPNRPAIVGTVHEVKGLEWVKKAPKSALMPLDMLEARLDCLGNAGLPEKWPLPVIVTARHPKEGGAGHLDLTERRGLLTDALGWATAVDIELRSARELIRVIGSAHECGRVVILSHHDFKATPSLSKLKELAARAADEGGDLFKVASTLRSPSDLLRLAELQSSSLRIPVIAMGMGNAGRFSRIMLGGLGSPLCYGWLGKPQVPGQWPALRMRALLDEVISA